jgi:hypothetical protein
MVSRRTPPRFEATDRADVRARVDGYLDSIISATVRSSKLLAIPVSRIRGRRTVALPSGQQVGPRVALIQSVPDIENIGFA